MNYPWHIAVVVPARDEQDLLPRCLRSILKALQLLPLSVTSEVIVVIDQSTDATLQIAQKLLRDKGVALETEAGCVGTARALGAQRALTRYRGPIDRCWLANTDADCEVPMNWLNDQLAFANAGVAAVAGIIDVDSFDEHDSTVSERFRRSYTIHADGTHPHIHGANLGVRADAYLRAGGWLDLPTAEDHDLWHRLDLAPHERVSDAGLCVVTSGRRKGRASLGFAGALAAHNEAAT